jgi:hypothetical protein
MRININNFLPTSYRKFKLLVMRNNQAHSFFSTKLTKHRSAVLFILLILTVCLTSLGMRLPALAGPSSGPGKPKPRPRAVIKTQITTCKQVVTNLADSVAFLPEQLFTAETPQAGKFILLPSFKICSCTLLPDSPSRAPPLISSPA